MTATTYHPEDITFHTNRGQLRARGYAIFHSPELKGTGLAWDARRDNGEIVATADSKAGLQAALAQYLTEKAARDEAERPQRQRDAAVENILLQVRYAREQLAAIALRIANGKVEELCRRADDGIEAEQAILIGVNAAIRLLAGTPISVVRANTLRTLVEQARWSSRSTSPAQNLAHAAALSALARLYEELEHCEDGPITRPADDQLDTDIIETLQRMEAFPSD